jgi:hypothetical protein
MVRSALALAFVCVGIGSLVACSAAPAEDGSEAASQGLECDTSGTWALKVSLPIKWPATFVLQGGNGVISNWVKTTAVQTGTDIKNTAKVCGLDIPPYQATSGFGGEKYGVTFPDATFELPTMPTISFNGTLSSKDVGATFTTSAVAALIGATMTNPATDAWPSAVAALVAADADGDSKPGISGDSRQGAGFFNPPVNVARSQRANHIYTAFRQVMTATGTVKSCSRIEGTAQIAVINNKPAIDSHVLGCRRVDGVECTASEFKLLDSAAPTYSPDGTVKITMVKVPEATNCADIRAMQFDDAVDGGADGGH